MSSAPVICFGQQPCGIFPRRFLHAKFVTARRLQAELGGRIVFFYHDSDHDPRETQTCLRHRKTGEPHTLNFAFENKLQRKHSPLYQKRVAATWRDTTVRQLPAYVDARWVEACRANTATNVAALVLFASKGHVWWHLAGAMAVANVVGSLLGTRLALRHGAGFVRGVFVCVVTALIAKSAWDAYFGAG